MIYDLWEAKHIQVNQGHKIEKVYHEQFKNVKFAGKLKEICSLLTGYPIETFYNRDKYNDVIPGLNISLRELMQRVGDGLRQTVDNSVWVRAALSNIRANHNAVITDVRYPNEIDAIIAQHGFLIRIVRPDNQEATLTGLQALHSSETALDGFNDDDFDYNIINNGTLDDLKVKVKLIMNELWEVKEE